MENANELRMAVAMKVSEDDSFRGRFIANPLDVIRDELNFEMPSGVRVEVHEDGQNIAHVLLPPRAEG